MATHFKETPLLLRAYFLMSLFSAGSQPLFAISDSWYGPRVALETIAMLGPNLTLEQEGRETRVLGSYQAFYPFKLLSYASPFALNQEFDKNEKRLVDIPAISTLFIAPEGQFQFGYGQQRYKLGARIGLTNMINNGTDIYTTIVRVINDGQQMSTEVSLGVMLNRAYFISYNHDFSEERHLNSLTLGISMSSYLMLNRQQYP